MLHFNKNGLLFLCRFTKSGDYFEYNIHFFVKKVRTKIINFFAIRNKHLLFYFFSCKIKIKVA